MPIGAEAAHCGGGRFVCGKRWVIQPLGALMAFSNRFASQQCIIDAGGAPREVPHHPSRVWQLWRTTQRSAKLGAECARRDGRQQPHHRPRHDRFRRGTARPASECSTRVFGGGGYFIVAPRGPRTPSRGPRTPVAWWRSLWSLEENTLKAAYTL